VLRFRGRHLLGVAAFLAGLSLAVVPTLGADQSVNAGDGGNVFSPKTVTVSAGERVTWTRSGGSHNVRFVDDPYEMPADPSTSWSTVSRTFTTPGTYRYYCEQHGDSGGIGMSGTVVVTPASTTGTPPPGGGPPGSGPPGTVNDKVAPAVKLSVSSGQRILRQRALVVDVRVDEQATVTASAKIATPGASRVLALKKVTRKLEPNARAKLKLKLSRKARAGVASALRRGLRLKAKVKIVAKDAAGNSRTSTKTVAVKK
jgi:plastocyanin